jgi:cell division protein FtsZ
VAAPAPTAYQEPAPQQQQHHQQQQDVRRPIEQPKRIVHELESGHHSNNNFSNNSEADSRALELERIAQQRELMQRKAEERRERLRMLSTEITSEAIKEKLEVPAYLRRNVSLDRVAHSSERTVSRFNLNDDNEILGDNRFLHDNVD